MSAKENDLSEAAAIEYLGRKLDGEGFLTIPQVANGTGHYARRTADALMIQTWPSRGLDITGIEYKRHRSDWRRELRDGQKAEPVADYCRFWVVLAPKGVVPLEEVPGAWGLWEIDEKLRLLRTKPPPAQATVKPVDMPFVAAVLRAAEKVNRNDAALEADRRKIQEEAAASIQAQVMHQTRRHAGLVDAVKEFEEASGLNIVNGWNNKRLGEGLKKLLASPDQYMEQLERDRVNLGRILELINSAIEERKP